MLSNLKKQRKLIVIKDCLFKISFAYFIPFIFVSSVLFNRCLLRKSGRKTYYNVTL